MTCLGIPVKGIMTWRNLGHEYDPEGLAGSGGKTDRPTGGRSVGGRLKNVGAARGQVDRTYLR